MQVGETAVYRGIIQTPYRLIIRAVYSFKIKTLIYALPTFISITDNRGLPIFSASVANIKVCQIPCYEIGCPDSSVSFLDITRIDSPVATTV